MRKLTWMTLFGCLLAAPALAAEFQAGTVEELKTAIQAANAQSNLDTIHLQAAAVYELTAELPQIIWPLVIEGHGATIQRNTAPTTPTFSILNADSALTVKQLTFRNGGTSGRSDATQSVKGGAIISFGDLTLEQVTCVGNTVLDVGGAIYHHTSGSINSPFQIRYFWITRQNLVAGPFTRGGRGPLTIHASSIM